MIDKGRADLDYVKRILEGALLYIDVNSVPASVRLRNNIQNAVHSIVEQLKVAEPTETELRRAADRIDGYDRDDLGESPDY